MLHLLVAFVNDPSKQGQPSPAEMAIIVKALVGAGGAIFALFILVQMLKAWLKVCRPNEILIFSGRKHKLPDGTEVGWRVIRGGRKVKLPWIENVRSMDMRLFPVEVGVKGAYSKGGIPLNVHAIANMKIASDPMHVRNAVERFLNTTPDQIALVAQQQLEGVLREVLSQLTPEEVNQDRLKFAESLLQNAKDDFDKLGLELDVLKVQHVSDEQQYLVNLGRARTAQVLRDAQNAENAANQTVAEQSAAARQRAESAKKQAEATVLQRNNQLRASLAQFEGQAKSIENEAAVASETARSIAEQELQRLRAEQEKLRLECDVFLPAEAKRMADEAKARGATASVLENNKAAAEALRVVAAEWQAAGTDGRDLYILQQLRAFVEAAILRVAETQLPDVTVVDGGNGEAFGAMLASFPTAVARVMRETGKAIGVDVDALIGSVARSVPAKSKGGAM